MIDPYFIKVRDFAIIENGKLVRLYCKMCGMVIGELGTTPVGRYQDSLGRIIEKHVEAFTRNDFYTELKIAYEDGSFHITNGCKNCLHQSLTIDQLAQITEVDEDDLELPHRNGAPVGIMKIKLGGGIV